MLDKKKIDELYFYEGSDLGVTFSDDICTFKTWSPISDKVYVLIYDDYLKSEFKRYEMKNEINVFSFDIPKSEVLDKYYKFAVLQDGTLKEFVDPYAKAVSINGIMGAIIDFPKTNPVGFEGDKRVLKNNNVDTVIYEVSVRDISIDKSSNIEEKGKFLGLCESNNETGLDYIKDLGVTHIQLLPIYDFSSIDETLANNNESIDNRPYNWGYDPANYNVPEGSYSTNPYNPYTRIKELKTLISEIHKKGLGVIMDVVYNHMYEYDKSGFHISMPEYFFRYKDGNIHDETGCGNVFASEGKMARKFIVDSVKYWANEYNLDGFRFDLMGLIDKDTMIEVRKELDKINPNIIIIGEGWDMNSILDKQDKSIQRNAKDMKGIGFFNDTMRDGLRGSGFIENDLGFISGDFSKKEEVKKSIVGGINYSKELDLWNGADVNQVVNYVECHDNHTFYDKLATNNIDIVKIPDMHKLGTSIVLLSQGIPFLHLGQEFLRTKNGTENSYNKPDSINKVDWNRKNEFRDSVDYVKGLLELRKNIPLFRMSEDSEIRKNLKFIDTKDSVIGYIVGDETEKYIVIHNAGEITEIVLDREYEMEILVNKESAGTNVLASLKSNVINIDELSTFVARIK